MKPAADLAPIEDLVRNILTLCNHINAATFELLVLVRSARNSSRGRIIEQVGKHSLRATAACLSSLALPIQAWEHPDLNYRQYRPEFKHHALKRAPEMARIREGFVYS